LIATIKEKSKMPRGGKRPGAGRKPGKHTEHKKTKAARKIAAEAAARAITPLEVMLQAMIHHHEAGNLDAAAAIAKDAAPYVHPRLSALTHNNKVGVQLEIVEVIVDGHLDQNNPALPSPTALPPV
jgi:hypothetical protein